MIERQPGAPEGRAGFDGGEGEEGSPLNLANALTALRILLAPVFLVHYVHGDRPRALAAFAAAAATDVLDGLVARALHQRTRLGAFLDPIADKFLAACALIALAVTGKLPTWLPVLVVARDVAQLVAAAILRSVHRTIPVAPTRIGKYATFALAFGAAASLRRALYRRGLLRMQRMPVPVVVVGNITVGGSGKTPLAAALTRALAERGWHPGIVSRGHGRADGGLYETDHGQNCSEQKINTN